MVCRARHHRAAIDDRRRWSYTRERSLAGLLAEREIRHIVTPPYTPRWHGKVERFHHTMERERAKGPRFGNHDSRCGRAALRA